ncbi:hypothetical protein VNO77_05006 [Canavalia gladiata]|uniref:Uncharacterized protein n=1 Tax=Canavalia gladiata TaxID=3824 RepID=A0AAN9MY91_CANGL
MKWKTFCSLQDKMWEEDITTINLTPMGEGFRFDDDVKDGDFEIDDVNNEQKSYWCYQHRRRSRYIGEPLVPIEVMWSIQPLHNVRAFFDPEVELIGSTQAQQIHDYNTIELGLKEKEDVRGDAERENLGKLMQVKSLLRNRHKGCLKKRGSAKDEEMESEDYNPERKGKHDEAFEGKYFTGLRGRYEEDQTKVCIVNVYASCELSKKKDM